MIYLAIGLVAGIIIMILRARQNLKARGDRMTVRSVTDEMQRDVADRKQVRIERKANLKAARYARRHPGKVARGEINTRSER
jgi:hypothetical protein